MFQYFQTIKEILVTVEEREYQNIQETIEVITKAIQSKKSVFIFGASHAGILAEEMFYRAGGLVTINPIFARELMLDNRPITATSQMERLIGYGEQLADRTPFQVNDVLIIHSVSGRNPVSIDLALSAKKKGVTIIALTNLKYSNVTISRHPSGKRLFEVADIILDNHGHIGDGACKIDGLEQCIGPSSTVIGGAILNNIVVEVTRKLLNEGISIPPIFYSANLDGGDEKNRVIYDQYRDSIHYEL